MNGRGRIGDGSADVRQCFLQGGSAVTPAKRAQSASFSKPIAQWCDRGRPTDIQRRSPLSTSPREERSTVSQDINVLALVKGKERYVFLYDDANRAETLRTLGRFASNPDLSFTWYDAAVLSQKIRQDSHKFVSASRFEVPLPSDVSDDEY